MYDRNTKLQRFLLINEYVEYFKSESENFFSLYYIEYRLQRNGLPLTETINSKIRLSTSKNVSGLSVLEKRDLF